MHERGVSRRSSNRPSSRDDERRIDGRRAPTIGASARGEERTGASGYICRVAACVKLLRTVLRKAGRRIRRRCGRHVRRLICRVQNATLGIAERRSKRAAAHRRECPICGWTGLLFRSFAVDEYLRLDAVCPQCGSFERHRALARFYPILLARPGCRRPRYIVHFAAEECLASVLRPLCHVYLRSTFDVGREADVSLDLTRLALRDGSCDVLLMNHVLDCMPDDHAAIREIHRVLRPGGIAVAVVGLAEGTVTRELPVASNSRYRVYGLEDLSKRFSPLRVSVLNAAEAIEAPRRRRYGTQAPVGALVLQRP